MNGAKWIRNLSVYVSGQNLLTATNYSWWDPRLTPMEVLTLLHRVLIITVTRLLKQLRLESGQDSN
jgi:hypothetical protein